MLLPFDHFSLQLSYAQRAAVIADLPLEQALMQFTQYWARVNSYAYLHDNNLLWSFDPTTPAWRTLVTRLQNGEQADAVAYDLYRQIDVATGDNNLRFFGCFRFDFSSEFRGDADVITLHFHNHDHSTDGPLSQQRRGQRLEELKSMFSAIHQQVPQAKVVYGGSWLYNINAYKRLFPASFTRDMVVEEIPFPRSSGIWGQFLNSEGQVKRDMADAFLARANAAASVDQMLQCFEFKLLYPRGDIADFYQHFGMR